MLYVHKIYTRLIRDFVALHMRTVNIVHILKLIFNLLIKTIAHDIAKTVRSRDENR